MMDKATIQEMVERLNDMLEVDPVIINALINTRLPLNDKLKEFAVHDEQGLGLLGVLNTLVGPDSVIVGEFCGATGQVEGFHLMERADYENICAYAAELKCER